MKSRNKLKLEIGKNLKPVALLLPNSLFVGFGAKWFDFDNACSSVHSEFPVNLIWPG